MDTVPWRRVALTVAAAAIALATVFVALRADGYPAVDATVPRATRWFVHEATGRVVLADGFAGRTLARLDVPGEPTGLSVVQSPSGVAVLDRSSATARAIDTAALRLGPPKSVSLAAAPDVVVGIGQAGLVAVDPDSEQGMLLPPDGDPVPFDVDPAGRGDATRVTPDGAVLTLAGGELTRVTTTTRDVLATSLADASFTLVGTSPLVLDRDRLRVRFGDGEWVGLPDDIAASELVLQEPGPTAECGWVAGDDRLWCVGDAGFVEDVEIPGLDVDGPDLLSIAGDAGALVRRATSTIVRLDWKAGRVLDDQAASVPAGSELSVSAAIDLVWIDQTDGEFVWGVNPWGINVIRKDDASSPLNPSTESGDGEEGEDVGGVASGNDEALAAEEHEPDENGIDDPPVAVDDPVTARSGASALIAVTANDFDPDGEAIALASVGEAAHGTVDVATAHDVSYLPEPGYVGLDQFEYTIVDGNGTEDTATVTIDLLPTDTVNQAPIGSPDETETGTGIPVVVDVLLNDIDPERDALRIDTFTQPDIGGEVSPAVGPSGLPGLRFNPPAGVSGTATFTYLPIDSFGAVGDAVDVEVEIAQLGDDNRPPIVRPDAVRVRRDVATLIPVLANDRDPDGDPMRIDVVRPAPPGLDVAVRGDQIQVVVRAGAARLSPFQYTVDDGSGQVVTGSVLVVLISDIEPNRPPIANADNATAVTGTQRLIDVLANDSDPDGDPVILVSVLPLSDSSTGTVRVQGDQIQYTAGRLGTAGDPLTDRFSYEISDGNGHEARGEVTVRVLPEAINSPPFAGDDSATTEVDVPVTIDVLRNDGDPSGEPPTIVGTPGCAGGGTAVLATDSRVTFTPPEGRVGRFSCTYEVMNSQGLSTQATIIVTVIAPSTDNDPPIVLNEEVAVVVEQQVVVDVLANDTDSDGPSSALRVVSSTTPSLGRAERLGSLITFTAGPVTGPTSITYQVGDDDGGVTTGQLVIRIVEPDPVPPVASDDRRTITGPGVATTIDVVANDADPDGVAFDLTVESITVQSGEGSASTTGGRLVTLVPAVDFVGDLVATYTVADDDGLTDTAQVTLTVLEIPNRAPIARDDQADVVNGGSVTVSIALNDQDPDGDPLTYSITSGPDPRLGSARLVNGDVVFDAVPGAAGLATVEYMVDDGEASAQATLIVSVLPCGSAPPSAPDVFMQTGYQQPIFVDLFVHARNGDIVEVGPPLGVPSGVYTPPAGENGNISFTYVVRNSCAVEDVGQVTIDVNQDPIGSPYVAQIGRTQPFVIPISALASDAEPLTILALEGGPAWMTLIDENRTILVDPAGRTGRAELVAVISDPGGLQVRVPVAVDLVNLAPVANPDVVRADTGPVTIEPLVNDSDPDGDSITLQSVPDTVTFSNGGVASIQRLGNDRLHVIPGTGVGTATFNYSVVDQFGLVSQETTVTVRVNSPPTAPEVDLVIPAGTTVMVTVDASDPDGDVLTLTIDDVPPPLTITIDGRTLTITAPLEAANLNFDLRYTVTDPFGASASQFIQIAVTEPPPTTTPPTTTTTPPTIPPPP